MKNRCVGAIYQCQRQKKNMSQKQYSTVFRVKVYRCEPAMIKPNATCDPRWPHGWFHEYPAPLTDKNSSPSALIIRYRSTVIRRTRHFLPNSGHEHRYFLLRFLWKDS